MSNFKAEFMSEKIFRKSFDDYFELLVINAQKYISLLDEAEEIVQDVYVKLWQQMDSLPNDLDIKAYLFRSVHNSCQNFLKHKQIVTNYKERIVAESKFSNIQNEEDNESREIMEALHNAINALPENWRQVFLMNRFENLKYREIAEKLSISPKTVEKYISKSLQHLQLHLKEYIPLILLIIRNL
ncbi:MAG: RNA polymerase sigma-70 factor [Bacteroidales bacterium]|nr:RNA polymerase sigma-70 factor [Bacteroidales bacterium]